MQPRRVGLPADAHKHGIGLESSDRSHHCGVLRAFHKALSACSEAHIDAFPGQHAQHFFGHITVFAGQKSVACFENGHVAAKCLIHAGKLERDVASTHNHEPCGPLGQ